MKCQNDDIWIVRDQLSGLCFGEPMLPCSDMFSLSDPPAPRYGVRNMRIDEETTYSMRVAWQPVDSRNVRHYRLSYISAKGDRAEETVRQGNRDNFALFHENSLNNLMGDNCIYTHSLRTAVFKVCSGESQNGRSSAGRWRPARFADSRHRPLFFMFLNSII